MYLLKKKQTYIYIPYIYIYIGYIYIQTVVNNTFNVVTVL